MRAGYHSMLPMRPSTATVPWGGGRLFEAYIPGTVSDFDLALRARTAARVAEAELALASEAREARSSPPRGMMFWSESLGSSHIEGVRPRATRVLHSLVAAEAGKPLQARGPAAAVVHNIHSHETAADIMALGPLTVKALLKVHDVLMSRIEPSVAGAVRTYQNWIGGRDDSPEGADYIPPPAEYCEPLLEDLIAYMRASEPHSALTAAALTHVQFELIHPFGDGNGRTGRMLMHSMLRRLCESDQDQLPPVSLALSRDPDQYFRALSAATRHGPGPSDHDRSEALDGILNVVATAAIRASAASRQYRAAARRLCGLWSDRMGGRRGNSVVHDTISLLPSYPSMTPAILSGRTGYAVDNCRTALRALENAGILKARTIAPAVRTHDADRVLGLYEVMAATITQPTAAAAEYDRLLERPFLDSPKSTGGSRVVC